MASMALKAAARERRGRRSAASSMAAAAAASSSHDDAGAAPVLTSPFTGGPTGSCPLVVAGASLVLVSSFASTTSSVVVVVVGNNDDDSIFGTVTSSAGLATSLSPRSDMSVGRKKKIGSDGFCFAIRYARYRRCFCFGIRTVAEHKHDAVLRYCTDNTIIIRAKDITGPVRRMQTPHGRFRAARCDCDCTSYGT